jgi:hypothetical protein
MKTNGNGRADAGVGGDSGIERAGDIKSTLAVILHPAEEINIPHRAAGDGTTRAIEKGRRTKVGVFVSGVSPRILTFSQVLCIVAIWFHCLFLV